MTSVTIPFPAVSGGDAWLLISVAALVVHYLFRIYEPRAPLIHVTLLGLPPLVLSFLPQSYRVGFGAVGYSYAIFWTVLSLSVLLYRLSPFHPLAMYPGPLLHKLTRLSFALISVQGRQHVYIQELHKCYGDVVRIGPNEISICNSMAIGPILGPSGFLKSEAYTGRNLRSPGRSLLASDGEERVEKRKRWNRAFSIAALKNYEEVISRRAIQLVDLLAREKSVDLGVRFSWFTFDFMGDMAFGGGPNMLEKGDEDGLWRVMEAGLVEGHFFANVPWTAAYARKIPLFGRDIMRLRAYCIGRARERVKNGSHVKDLFYYLNNEDGVEAHSRPLPDVIRDGSLAVVAGSDTTASVLSNMFFFLLRDPETYARLQAEVDKFYPPGENALDTKHHQDMPILHATINETLRLMPAVPSGSLRTAPPGGKVVGPYFVAEGTNTYLPLYTLQRDPRNFSPNSEAFWVDRWLISSGKKTPAEAGIDTHAFVHNQEAFIPFSFGPANCVGKTLALQEMRMTACLIMQRLEMCFAPGYDPSSYVEGLRDFFVIKKPPFLVDIKIR
ncbi:high nitrogen upregulated cytochrome P450 monooxygenase 2 [Obba rivulosa]|uniref:High nitrogen upregulated cytochrome P450 monooxygenase 2 n=1 Tax=Obba rivulosa TaxID=1052685 RepID=A0A8E2ASC3_9APHY|nr:high nitrogen upregulated cytochrome P450 monooxygenase 2 [Obba rivulosa]